MARAAPVFAGEPAHTGIVQALGLSRAVAGWVCEVSAGPHLFSAFASAGDTNPLSATLFRSTKKACIAAMP